MQFRVRPFPHLVYYSTQIDFDAPLMALPGAAISADSFLANSVTIKRNSVFDSSYQIDFAVSSNLTAEGLKAKCLVRMKFLDAESGASLGYVEATHVDGTNVFRASVATDDSFTENGEMVFTSSIWSDAGVLAARAPLPESLRVLVELYYDNASPDVSVAHVIRGGRIFQLVNAFKTTDDVKLYRSLDRVVASNMHVTEEGTFHCSKVPLVGTSFFLNPRIGLEITKVIERYHSEIFSIFDLLHNNTSVDVKFYNTYGPSRAFNVDRTNLSLVLEVRPRGKTSEELRQKIRSETAAFILTCSENTKSRFSISNLLRHLENNVQDIAFIRFVSLNGMATQNVEHIYSDAAMEEDVNRVPEILNAATVVRGTLEEDPYSPDVTVNFI